MSALWPILVGTLTGLVIWFYVVRPMQLNTHERRRRDYGLPPKRKLPEDDA